MANIQDYSKIRYNGSAAYEIAYEPDYGQQEQSQRDLSPKPKKAVSTSYGISAFAVVGYLAIAVVLVALLLTYVQYTAIAAETVEYREKIETLSEEQRRLTIQYEKTFDMNEIEAYAKGTLGMDAPRADQLSQVALNASDKAVVYGQEYGDTFLGGVAMAASSVMEYFG